MDGSVHKAMLRSTDCNFSQGVFELGVGRNSPGGSGCCHPLGVLQCQSQLLVFEIPFFFNRFKTHSEDCECKVINDALSSKYYGVCMRACHREHLAESNAGH